MAISGSIGHRTPFERWQDGIDAADSRWDEYDDFIRRTVELYNAHLARTTEGYHRLDWKLVKAMAWTETGADNNDWRTKPLQIGNQGDPGLRALLRGEEGSDLIVPPAMGRSFIAADKN